MAKKRICLDAGHYGPNYNAGAVKGYFESAVVWKLTQYEKEYLESFGIEVVMTRTDINENPGLTARGQMAKGCDLFVSNHTNATSRESINRAVVMHMVPRKDSTVDEKSVAFADKLANVIEDVMGVDGNEIYFVKSDSDRDGNGEKDDNYYGVLNGAFSVGVPGVIAEHSFHTNPGTCIWLMNDDNLRKLAKACAKCMAEFVGVSTHTIVVQEPVSEFPPVPFMVRVDIDDLNYRSEPKMGDNVLNVTGKGSFTIVEVVNGWGRLKSGVGWIWLGNPDYCTIIKEEAPAPTPVKPESKYPMVPFMVRVKIDDLNYRSEPSMEGKVKGVTGKGSFTIVETTENGWGKLKSGVGWIYLDNPEYCQII